MKTLPKVKIVKRKRLGQGYGSGKGGHTVGRGQKGQKTRNTMGVLFEGVKMKKSFVKRLPFMRGKDKFKASPKPLVVSLDLLDKLPKDVKTVDIKSLIDAGMVDKVSAQKFGVKILDNGEIKRKLSVKLSTSESAARKIVAAGGEVLKKD